MLVSLTETAKATATKPRPAREAAANPIHRAARSGLRPALLLGALGVVYGDIGTSPLYAVQTVFAIDNGRVHPNSHDVFGIVSMIFWSITLIVSLKYVLFVMRADNDGEGGVMALAALARRSLGDRRGRAAAIVMALGVLGAALFYGDSVITPSISVLSAIEGLEVSQPDLTHLVLPLSAAILTLLFVLQRFGTQRVGGLFGPVMVVWFLAIGSAGLVEVIRYPGIVRGLSPSYAFVFIIDRPVDAFVAAGAVVLAITGAEALYADMGHFGAAPIRRAWFALVFPALTLNYLAQAALILHHPASRANPFYELLPHWAQLPMVLLAAAATVIASQAVISGAYSMTRQALRLGFLPHLRIRQTSKTHEGQIYLPAVNWALLVAVLVVTFGFRHSARLASAYGVAVTGTFIITTALLVVVARNRWNWSWWRLPLVLLAFGVAEVSYFAANLSKVAHGGWLTLLIAAAVFVVMVTWQRGRQVVTNRRAELEGPLSGFLAELHRCDLQRVPGVGIYAHPNARTTPLALRATLRHMHVLHEQVVILSGRTTTVPHIPWDERFTITPLGTHADGITHIAVDFGFQDPTDFPEALRRATPLVPALAGVSVEDTSWFVSRITMRRAPDRQMAQWRKRLFITMAHNAASQAEFLRLPVDSTVVLSADVAV